jgi:hypothetical protein
MDGGDPFAASPADASARWYGRGPAAAPHLRQGPAGLRDTLRAPTRPVERSSGCRCATFEDDGAIKAPIDSANAKALSARAAVALGGDRRTADDVAFHVSSRFDPFLNQVFVDAGGDPEEAVRRLAGRPSFVWLASAPDAVTRGRLSHVARSQ